jgi:GDP-L-fucose synthase
MKILVTGGFGLVGNSIQKLVINNPNFTFLCRKDGDLRNRDDVIKIFKLYKPDIVIHLCAVVGGLYFNIKSNYKIFLDNLKINTNIIEMCNEYKVKKLINVLSTCIFPKNNVTYPLTSKQLHNGVPDSSNYGYSFSKRISHVMSELLSNETEIKVINLIPTNLYGEEDNYNLENSHVIPGLIHKCYLAKKNNTSLYINGSGNARRQFLYTNDFANIILESIHLCKNTTIIVAPHQENEISIKQLVNKIVGKFNFIGKVIYDTTFVDGQYSKTSDSHEVLQHFVNFKFTEFEIGLSNSIDYFIKNYEFVRK